MGQIHSTGSFDLDCDTDTAFPFFSPEGEREWVSGWVPKPIYPEQIAFARDTVFHEGAPGAIWTIIDVDWREHRAEYVRVAPASHSAHIIVKLEPSEAARTRVVVSYTVTAFGDDQSLLQGFSEHAYTLKMCDWQRWITRCLSSRKARS